MKIFFSYSHKDETVRDELETHLSALKRNGLIEAWHDRRIAPGDSFAGAIDQNLEAADVVLLLVSPHFIASDYCIEVELARAMERHQAGEARVIPIIVEHCQWHDCPFGALLALPKDGTPISKYPNPHEALSEIAGRISELAKAAGGGVTPQKSPRESTTTAVAALPRSSNLRVTKSFTEKDRDDFIEHAFDYVARFFEGSLKELHSRNPETETKFKQIDATRFEARVYRDGKLKSQCAIWLSSGRGQDIRYSSDPDQSGNSWNESLAVCDDGQALLLKPMNMGMRMFSGHGKVDHLSEHGAAEYFWEMVIEPLQRQY